MAAEGEDRVLRFLAEFASMSERERDAAVDALAQEDRDALIALEEARTATAQADLIAVLDGGHGGLDKLRELDEPAYLLAAINLAVRERPQLVVETLFAAVALYRGWDVQEPAAFVALRERWLWHVHEQVAARDRGDLDRGGGE